MKRNLLFPVLFFCINSFAQQILVTGKIMGDDGKPVAFASIFIKHSLTGVQSDINGEYAIKASLKSDTLVYSAVSYVTTEEPVLTNPINVTMRRSDQDLSEVIVVSGFSVRRSLAGSVAGVNVVAESFGFKTWERSGLPENSVQLSVGDKDFLPLKAVQVSVQVDGFRARVLFDYFFYSDREKQLRGDFRLKLPTGASPFYFAFGGTAYLNKDKDFPIYVNYPKERALVLHKDTIRHLRSGIWSDVKEAVVAPKEKASYGFNEVVRGSVDPALAEWAGADVFSCSIYPIQQKKLHRIVIGYDINLLEIADESMLHLSLPYEHIEKNIDINIAAIHGLQEKIAPAIPGRIMANGKIKYSARHFKETAITISQQVSSPVFLKSIDRGDYFATSCKPAIPLSAKASVEKDAIFLLDVSLSSQPDKMNVWLKTIEGILNNNRKQINRFAVLCFNVDAGWWQNYYCDNNAYNVDSFLNYARRLSLIGATDLQHALEIAAYPSWLKQYSPRTMFLMSDADASWGENNVFHLSSIIPEGTKVFTYTTGLSETDTRTLDHLSRQTNGAVFSVLNEEEIQKASTAIQYVPWRIKSLACDGTTDLLIAGRPYYVYPGQKLVIAGRGVVDHNSILRLTLEQGKEERVFEFPASQIISSCISNRIYGQVAVNQLEDFSFKAEKAGIQYAIHFEVAGQACSFIMLENNGLYKRFGIDTAVASGYVQANPVTPLIQHILAGENAGRTLGSAKADMIAWLSKMKNEKLLLLEEEQLLGANLAIIPEKAFQVSAKQIRFKNITNDEWYDATLKELDRAVLDYDRLMRMIKLEKRWSGKADAFKLISSFAERNRGDFTLLREVAYTLASWGLDDRAYQLLRRIILARPAEPAAYLAAANSLVKMNKPDLASVYYDIAFLTNWDNRFDGFNLIAALQYAGFLKQIITGAYTLTDKTFAQKRLAGVNGFLRNNNITVSEADLVVIISWNTDNTDVDLHLREPSGEECFYGHKKTASGGFLSNDATDGFGPEMYYLQKALPGKYHLDLQYYRDSDVRTSAQSKILVDVYKYWGTAKEQHTRKIVVLKKSSISSVDDEEDKVLKDVVEIDFR